MGGGSLEKVSKDSGRWSRQVLAIFQFQDHHFNHYQGEEGIWFCICLSEYEVGFPQEIKNRVPL